MAGRSYEAYFRIGDDGCTCDNCRQSDLDVQFRARALDTLCRQIERTIPDATVTIRELQTPFGMVIVGWVESPSLHTGNYYSIDEAG